jgi:hypothetical protein
VCHVTWIFVRVRHFMSPTCNCLRLHALHNPTHTNQSYLTSATRTRSRKGRQLEAGQTLTLSMTGCRLSMIEFQVLVRRCFSLNTRAAEPIPGAMLSLDLAHAAVGVWFWRSRNPDKLGQQARRSFGSLSCHPEICSCSNFMSPTCNFYRANSTRYQPKLPHAISADTESEG